MSFLHGFWYLIFFISQSTSQQWHHKNPFRIYCFASLSRIFTHTETSLSILGAHVHRVSASSSSRHTLCEYCFDLPFDFFHSYGSVIIVGYLSRSTDLNRASLVLVISSEDPEVILIQVPTVKIITLKRGVSSLQSILVGRSVSIQFPYTFRLP